MWRVISEELAKLDWSINKGYRGKKGDPSAKNRFMMSLQKKFKRQEKKKEKREEDSSSDNNDSAI